MKVFGGNFPRRFRCIQLNISSRPQPPKSTEPSTTTLPPSDTQIYIEFLNTLKDLILISFDSLVKDRDDSVKRGEASRLLPGWNWGSWFLEKETLAYSYEGMHLMEDALIVYDELEASLEMIMRGE
jgi:trafficking protein particle complex subunit 10